MGRGPAKFTQADIVRAIRGARASGMDVSQFSIDRDGTIVVSSGFEGSAPVDKFDDWKVKRDARSP